MSSLHRNACLEKYHVAAVKSFRSCHNVAVLESSGTGKSFFLSRVIALSKELYGSEQVVACSVTNNAPRNIGCITLHRLFRDKINWEGSNNGLWESLQSNISVPRSLLYIYVLIIDEISTVKASVLDAIDAVLRRLPRTPAPHDLPFGGRKIIVSGEAFQLEPFFEIAENNKASAFESSFWRLWWKVP